MNSKLEEFKRKIRNNKVAVLGIGISNKPLIRFLANLGADITAFDKSDEEKMKETIEEFKDLSIEYSLGDGYLAGLKAGFDLVFRTPGMRFDLPELVAARSAGAEITSEMEVFFDLCPAKIYAVTGSDGKTTTTTLIYSMLKEQGYKCWLGGNIGTPLLSRIEEIDPEDKVVLELSSFQLHTMKKSPQVAVITNISPNHLDIHSSMEEYVDAKKNIFRYQSNEGMKLVLNYDNDITRSLAKEASSQVLFFSRRNELHEGAMLKNNKLVIRKQNAEKEILDAGRILIPGLHNIENYLAAISAVYDDVDASSVQKVAYTFKGVEHRIEMVREWRGVKFYNSSIDSSPKRTMAALATFKQRVILIAGGKDKNIPYDELGKPLAEKVKHLILIGPTGKKIEKALIDELEKSGQKQEIPIQYCTTYEQVIQAACQAAKPEDIVLLSPASTSFDMFKNFEERGNTFKKLVNELSE